MRRARYTRRMSAPTDIIATDHAADPVVERIREAAIAEGFDRIGIAEVGPGPAADRLRQWTAAGMHGSMEWLARNPDRRADPRRVVDGARTVLVATRSYWTGDPIALEPDRARISRYAWGDEYHDVLGAGIRNLYHRIEELIPGVRGRYYVDTGPVMEKAWAEAAGLGWIGKHTNLISVGEGSWFFLAAIILDVALPPDRPARDHCGTCTACIDVCPTAAIIAPYVLDARRCISYLTIENRGPIPRELRPAMGNHVFGCDDCQDVCPWNRFARESAAARAFAPRSGLAAPALVELLALDAQEFARTFRGSPVKRARRRGLLRNVAVALGNSGDPAAVPALVRALADEEALVRGHSAWALGRLGGEAARASLGPASRSSPTPGSARRSSWRWQPVTVIRDPSSRRQGRGCPARRRGITPPGVPGASAASRHCRGTFRRMIAHRTILTLTPTLTRPLALAASVILCVAAAAPAQVPAPGLVYPVDLVAEGDGWVIADFKAPGLLRLSARGDVEALALGEGLPRTPMYGTRAVIASPDGNGWIVADPATFGLYRVDAAGTVSTITTELDIPQGLAAYDEGSVLVSDLRSGLGAVLRVGLDGGTTVFAEVPSPKGIVAVGDAGFVVVSHGERGLYRIDRAGRVERFVSGAPFDFPHDLVAEEDGSVVVTDGYASALFRVTPAGEVSVIAQGEPLRSPQGIVRTAGGDYVVVDPQAGAVFRVSAAGEVSVLARVGD